MFSSGYAANVGTIAALAGRGDAIYSDHKNHASMIDGCRLSRADVHVFPHRDLWRWKACCESALQLSPAADHYRKRVQHGRRSGAAGRIGRCWPSDTTACCWSTRPMPRAFSARRAGVGRGTGRGGPRPVRVGTLSKALGSAGGFVCGSRSLIEWLANRARSYVFSTALPPAVCAASMAALEIVAREPERRSELGQRAADLCNASPRQGWNLGDSESQIVPLVVGDVSAAMRLAAALSDQGILAPAIRPPSVPEGQSLVRISLSHPHTSEMVERLVAALSRCGPSARTTTVSVRAG